MGLLGALRHGAEDRAQSPVRCRCHRARVAVTFRLVTSSSARHSSALLIAVALVLACRGDQAGAPAENDPALAENAALEKGAPKITADEAVYDFGAIKATDVVEHVFEIRNVGDADLKVERVQKT